MKMFNYIIVMLFSVTAFSQIISPSDGNKFFYNGLADVTFQYALRGSGGRAFVHDNYNVLSLNYGEDFSGGTRIGKDVYFKDGGNSYVGSGNFGIGTSNPQAKLSVQASADGYPTPLTAISISGPNSPANLNSARDLSWDFAAAGSAVIRSYRGSNWNTYLQFMTNDILGGNAPKVRMHIDDDGNIGIGTTNPTSKLTVAGNIHAQEVKVTVNAGVVPDYVFAKDYKLKSLQEVEDYIKHNSHLPEIPSAQEIEKNGLMLAEMNLSLLKKMEEMTLYMIEQGKEIKNLKKENEVFKTLSDRLSKVENQLNN